MDASLHSDLGAWSTGQVATKTRRDGRTLMSGAMSFDAIVIAALGLSFYAASVQI